MNMIRVMIADDHDLVRESIKAILAKESDIEIVATAQDGNEAINLATTKRPDVIVMDISMPKLDGIRAAKYIHENKLHSRVIILSMHVSATLVRQALKVGVNGYVLKARTTDELPQAIRVAYEDKLYISPAIPPSFLPPAGR